MFKKLYLHAAGTTNLGFLGTGLLDATELHLSGIHSMDLLNMVGMGLQNTAGVNLMILGDIDLLAVKHLDRNNHCVPHLGWDLDLNQDWVAL